MSVTLLYNNMGNGQLIMITLFKSGTLQSSFTHYNSFNLYNNPFEVKDSFFFVPMTQHVQKVLGT